MKEKKLTAKELFLKLAKLLENHPEYGDYSITIPCECGYVWATPVEIDGKCFYVKEEWKDIKILSEDDDDPVNYKKMGYILL